MPAKNRTEAYAQMFLNAVRLQVVIPDHLSRTELRLWLLLVTALEWGGDILLSQRQISELLGITEGDVSRAIRTLMDEGLLLRERPERGRQWHYRLPTVLVSRGPLSQLPWRRTLDEQRRLDSTASMKNAST
jgi:biotin operon repressor